MGKYKEATKELEKVEILDGADEESTKHKYGALRRAFQVEGKTGYWQEELRLAERGPDATFYWKAAIHAQLNHRTEVFDYLKQSLSTRELDGDSFMSAIENIVIDEYWDDFREEPEFKYIVDQVGFDRVALPQ
jgi:hypothetical protein